MSPNEKPEKQRLPPVTVNQSTQPRRGLRLHEGLALGMLCVIMACAWIVTLTG